MGLRLIEIILPWDQYGTIKELIEKQQIADVWYEKLEDSRLLIKILTPSEKSVDLLDILENRFSVLDQFRIIVMPVEASIPRPAKEEEEEEEKKPKEKPKVLKISREELYSDLSDTTNLTWSYFVMVVLSTIVAAIGILKDNVIIVIGAMVIAPLLGPNVTFSLATTLGDIHLTRHSLRANFAGIFTALLLSILAGYFLSVDPTIPEIASRTNVDLGDIGLALASGSAGALAVTIGISTALVGVMVAVALLPPLVTLGLLIGSGHVSLAFDTTMLFMTNLICINLAGVLTFFIVGIRPLSWWEADRARKSTIIAIALWIFMLSLLIAILLVSQTR